MYYRIVTVNTKTNERTAQYQTFTSKKKAIAFATEFEKLMPNARCEVFKSDMKTRVY